MTTPDPIVLIKIGGSTLGAEDTSLRDIVDLQRSGHRPVVVHGGGPAITKWMAKLGVRTEFIRGLRVTDAPGLEVVTAALAGMINKQLVADLLGIGAKTFGLSGVDGALLRGTVTDASLGYVAGSVEADPTPVETLLAGGFIPVIAPIAVDSGDPRQLLNVNGDTAAGAIATALRAAHLIFLTDVDGVLDSAGRLLQRVPRGQAEALLSSGVVKGGMVPKLEACVAAVKQGTATHIVNGTRSGALREVLSGRSIGTTVV